MLQLSDEALLLWCRRLLASRLTSMNWSCLRQVQQFLLTLELDGLLPEGVRISDSLTRALAASPAELAQASPVVARRKGGAIEDLEWHELGWLQRALRVGLGGTCPGKLLRVGVTQEGRRRALDVG